MAERVGTDLISQLIEFKDFTLSSFATDIRSDIRICGALGGSRRPSSDVPQQIGASFVFDVLEKIGERSGFICAHGQHMTSVVQIEIELHCLMA